MPESTIEVHLADLPQFQALVDFARDISQIAEERDDEELLTRVQRLLDEITPRDLA